MRLCATDGFEHTDRPSDSGDSSLIICAWVACGTARAIRAQTATATGSGQRAGSLGIAAFQLGMEGRQRRAHELRDLALCREAMGIESAREPRLAGCPKLMHVAEWSDG